LTLVIDSNHGSPVTVAWCLSTRGVLEDAICDLRCREETVAKHIGHIKIDKQRVARAEDPIFIWAKQKKLDAVVWTALKSNFRKEAGATFSVDAVIAYVKKLGPSAKVKAAEYVWRAPEFVRTPVRSALKAEPWFSRTGS